MKLKEKIRISDFPLLIIAFEVLFIIYMNTLKCSAYPELDMAKLYRHAIEMVRNGSIVIDGWNYISTMELDCSLLFALPFYALTKNIYISFGISNIIFLFCYLYIFYDILKKLNVRRVYKYISVILLLIPYRMGMLEYFNMMFYNGGQYVIKVLVPLILIDLIIEDDNYYQWGKKNVILLIMLAILMTITSLSSGSYVLISGVFPVIIGYVLNIIISGDFKNIKINKLIVFGVVFASFALGYLLCRFLHVNPNSEGMDIVSPSGLVNNVFVTIWGYFSIFLGNGSPGVLSIAGIDQLLRYSIAIVILIIICFDIKMAFDGDSNRNSLRIFVMPFAVTTVILCLTRVCFSDVFYPERYFFIGLVPIFLTVPYFLEWIEKYALNKLVCYSTFIVMSLLVLLLIPISILDVRTEIRNGYDGGYRGVFEVMDYVKENNIENVFWLYNLPDGEVARMLEPDIRSTVINFSNEGLPFLDEARDFYYAANDASYYPGVNILLEKQGSGDFDRMPDYIKSAYQEIGVLGGYTAYSCEKCVF